MNKSNQDSNALTRSEASLPARWYFDPDHYRRELKDIWLKSWIYVCRLSDLKEPLSYRTIQVGDQNIVVLRAEDGGVRAFHNSCRHRGSLLCTEHAGHLGSKLIVCPYHQWAYAADDGRLVKTSSSFEPTGFDKSDFSLFPVSVAEWRGLVFINLDNATQFDPIEVFHREVGNLRNHPLEDMVTIDTWRTETSCNWKTFWENFNECLHCPNVHPELCDLVPIYGRRISGVRDLPGWQDHADSGDPKYVGGLREGSETWSTDGSAQGHVIPSLTAEELARGQTYLTSLPSVFAGAYADHVRIVRMLPLGPEKTELTVEWLVLADTAADPDYDRSKIVDFAKLVVKQDLRASELNQRGLHAAPLEQGVLMPEEHYVKQFQDWVRMRLADRST